MSKTTGAGGTKLNFDEEEVGDDGGDKRPTYEELQAQL